jgi:hypothetical protein
MEGKRMNSKLDPTRGFLQNLRFTLQILCPDRGGRPITIIEKLAGTAVLLGRFLSLSNFGRWWFRTERAWSNFVDIYLLLWLASLALILFWWPVKPWIAAGIAVYQIVMILANEFAVILVDTRANNWHQVSIRRTVLLAFVNFSSIIIAYAVIYKVFNCIGFSSQAVLTKNPLDLLYFSLVTITTLGYGDLVPLCPQGRIIVIFELVTSVLFVVAVLPSFLGALATSMSREYDRYPDEVNKNDYQEPQKES